MKRLSAVILCLVMLLSLIPAAAAEEIVIVGAEAEEETIAVVETGAAEPNANVAINEANFPDASFRNYVKLKCDEDKNDVLSAAERDAVYVISCGAQGIASLKGVEHFPNLSYLFVGSNELSTLDLSQNPLLTNLDCRSNRLSELDVSGLPDLINLSCSGNSLSELDLSRNTQLRDLRCSDNALSELDVSGCPELQFLLCAQNQIGALDVTQNPKLQELECYGNALTRLDVTQNPKLLHLLCQNNRISLLDLSCTPNLTILDCHGNRIYTLNISACRYLLRAYNKGSQTVFDDRIEYDAGVEGEYDRLLIVSPETLIVTTPPYEPAEIATQPQSLTAAAGGTARFTVEAKGTDLHYQWYFRTSVSGAWTKCSGTGYNTAALTVEAKSFRSGYQYFCRVWNDDSEATTRIVTLTVVTVPAVTTQPKSRSAAVGETVTFTVAATGGKLRYQWYYRTSSSGSWTKSTGTGAATKTISVEAKAYRDGYQYRCRVSNAAGYKYSSAATLTVLTRPAITTQPASRTAAAGTTVKFTVKASGGDLSYQWYYRTSPTGAWTKCTGAGAATATLSVEAKSYRSGYQYRCRVSNAAGYKYSSAATLTVK